jgi:hypothetical protein
MGLFDFFRRKQISASSESSDDLDQPRCRHYTLAHLALRSVAFEQPLMFLGVLASPKARAFLADMLVDVSEHCKDREPRGDFGVDDIGIHTLRVGSYPCAVLEMPRPRAMIEAHFVAAVLLEDPATPIGEGERIPLRYFTLEKGASFDGRPRTVLCEWTANGTHANLGDGPPAELAAFVKAIQGLMVAS